MFLAGTNLLSLRILVLWSIAKQMADKVVPHFHNSNGVDAIQIGAKEFMCIGARPPLDHPHVFLDMGADNSIVCPYCSTLYTYNPELGADKANPADCTWTPDAA